MQNFYISDRSLAESRSRPTLLLIDQDCNTHSFLKLISKSKNYHLLQAGTGGEGLHLASEALPDAILLDLGLPDLDGNIVIRRLREFCASPIIVLSGRKDPEEKIKALDLGANDFVEKPFHPGELMARLRVALRPGTTSGEAPVLFRSGTLEVDFQRRLVRVDNEIISLTRNEYTLLALLIRNAGQLLTHQQLLFKAWGPKHVNQMQYLRVYIGYLRRKLGSAASLIETQRGVGYRMIKAEPHLGLDLPAS
jgi:two-component system KDP operon response regulator KdpE